MLLLQLGSMPSSEIAEHNTRLFAFEAAPYVRDLWSDREGRWSPTPLPSRRGAGLDRAAGTS
jgi:hypothetical protein